MSSTPQAPLPQYGRRYQLQIKFPPDENGNQTVLTLTDSSFEPEALRITFDVYTVVREIYWYADIVVYNLDEATTAQIIGNVAKLTPSGTQQGMEVILSAGYQNNYGVIWDGFVMQPKWDRENVTDFKLTLHCVIGMNEETRNFVANTYSNISQYELIGRMAKDAFRPIPIQHGAISTQVHQDRLPRGKTVFGNPRKYMSLIAEDNNMMTWLTAKGFTMASPSQDIVVSDADIPVFTPQTGIVGTPVQTQSGAQVRLLLDYRVQVQKPLMQIKLDSVVINQITKQAGDFGKIGLLSYNGKYIVVAVRYLGDTRGQDWYTEATLVTPELYKLVGIAITQ